MGVYLVRLQAPSVRATLEEAEGEYSFLKNEYVWAASAKEAIEKARENVKEALKKKSTVRQDGIDDLALIVDEVKGDQSLLSLFAKQGFVFCVVDNSSDTE